MICVITILYIAVITYTDMVPHLLNTCISDLYMIVSLCF